jgi:hypothetical protein
MGHGTKYELDLSDQSAEQVADLIKEWRAEEDSSNPFSDAWDLLDSIETWLRANAEEVI